MIGKDLGCGHAADASQTAPAKWFGVLITAAAVAVWAGGTSTPLGRDRGRRVIERWASSRRLWDAVLPAELLALPEE
jgi:hypothetical protein